MKDIAMYQCPHERAFRNPAQGRYSHGNHRLNDEDARQDEGYISR